MGESVSLPHDATLRTYPARQYKSKRYQAAYSCTHCRETLSGKPVAYSLWIPWSVSIPARDASQLFFDFCSEEHARLWLNDQVMQAQAGNQARALAYRASLSETKACIDCKQEFLVNEYGHLAVPYFDMHSSTCERCGVPLVITYEENGRLSFHCPNRHTGGIGPQYEGHSSTRCPRCNEERRKINRQVYPLCPMCNTPTRLWDFLREYHGHHLDLIKVCCKNCIPQFEALPETGQLELLRCAMVKAYGETAVIYALQYDDYFPCQHIGRTKHYTRRMAEYRRNWHTEIKHHFILEEIAFGPLSMEREARWMMHALKCRWPIDNFELLKGEDGLAGRRRQARLTEAVKSFEPLTAPFEVVASLIQENFMNTCDMHIVHWFVEQYGVE